MKEDPEKEKDHKRTTLRDIAAELGVSHVTVSRALRNMSNVSSETKTMIQAKADEMGYVPDPLLASLSRYSKTGKSNVVRAELAWINIWDPPERLRQHKEFDLYWHGASDNAKRMGYHIEAFNLCDLPVQRLKSILRTRNIQGLLLPPLGSHTTLLDEFNWGDFVVVRFGKAIPQPQTHMVSSAQLENAMLAFDRMRLLGYNRIGFVCEYARERFFGCGYSWAQRALPASQQLPLLTWEQKESVDQRQVEFQQWLEQNRPDAILTDSSSTLHMLANLGYRVPHDIALATTTVHDTEIDAGIDQRPYEIGWAATRMLAALINEKAYGIPDCPTELLIEGQWTDGSMLPERHIE